MKLVDTFSGLGAFPHVGKKYGYEVAAVCEIDPKPREVLARKFPEALVMEDIRHVTSETIKPLGKIDIITGGFPCQDISVAGNRKGLAGERSGLFFEFARLVGDVRPNWIVIENVPGLLSSNSGRDFYTVLSTLDEFGYLLAWRVLDAQYFGVPQRRRRLFIVGSLGNGGAAQIFSEQNGVPWYPAQSRAQREAVTQGFSGGAGKGHTFRMRGFGDYVDDTKAGTLKAKHQKDTTDLIVPFTLDARNHVVNPGISGTLQAKPNGGYSLNYINPVAFPFRTGGSYDMGVYEELSPTLTTSGKGGGNVAVADDWGIRRFTPRECERLMGLPDDWTAGHSDTARYRMIGNSIAVPVIDWLFHQITRNT